MSLLGRLTAAFCTALIAIAPALPAAAQVGGLPLRAAVLKRASGAVVGPVTGDPTALTVLANGWQTETVFQGLATGQTYTLSPDSSPRAVITVRSPGYPEDCNNVASAPSPTTIDRTVVLTRSMLQAYPNQANPTESANGGNAKITAPASEYVYSGDSLVSASFTAGAYGASTTKTITSGLTNSSSTAYPKVIGRWADAPKQIIGAADFDVEFVGYHAFAQKGKPFACVLITGTPTTGSPVTKVASYAKSSKYGDNLSLYKAPFSTSDFPSNGNANATFTIAAYPWVGDAAAVLDTSGASFPSLTTLAPQVHRTVGPTVTYAYADNSTGNDTTCVASTTPATAAASPCLTPQGGVTKLAAASSNISGFKLRLKNTGVTYTWDGTSPTGTRTAPDAWFTIEGDPADSDPYNNITIQTSTTTSKLILNTSAGNHGFVRFANIGITIAAGFHGFFDGNGNRNSVWFDHVKFTNNLTGNTAWCLACEQMFVTNSAGTVANAAARTWSNSSTNLIPVLIRATTSNAALQANAVLSTTIDASGITGSALLIGGSNLATSNVIAHNVSVNSWAGSSAQGLVLVSGSLSPVDVAVTNLKWECAAGSGCNQPLLALGENTNGQDVTNVVLDYWTVKDGSDGSGARVNIHNDPNTNPTTAVSDQSCYVNFSVRRSLFKLFAVKDDVFHGSNESDTGASFLTCGWPKRYGVGMRDLNAEASPDLFAPDYWGINTARAHAITYDGSDRANAGAPLIPAGAAYQGLTWDLNGVARRTDGTGVAGALEGP